MSYSSRSGEAPAAVAQIEACANEIDNWMGVNKLKLRVVSSRYRPRPLVNSVSINDYYVQPSVSERNLRKVVDRWLSLVKHFSSICKSAFFHIRRIAKIREYWSEESTAALAYTRFCYVQT